MSSDEKFGLGTSLPYQRVVEIAEKWIPRLQEVDTNQDLDFDDYIFRIQELGDVEPYLDIMADGLYFFANKQDGPIPQEFIEDVKGFVAPNRSKDYGTQESIRYKLDKLGIPT